MKKREILQFAEILFAHTEAFNFPAVFANRDNSREFILSHIRSCDSRILLVSDILGSGKTFLLNMVMNELKSGDHKTLICGRVKPDALNGKQIIVIDEWDIKANPKRLKKSLDVLISARAAGATVPTILLGDFTLRSANVYAALGGRESLAEVPMEPLNPYFFNLALQNRIARVRNKKRSEELAEIDREIVTAPLGEALAPEWKVTSANFRDVFRTLSQLCNYVEPSMEDGTIGPQEAAEWVLTRAPLGMSEAQAAFFADYVVALREQIQHGGWGRITPMTLGEMHAQFAADAMSLEALRAEVVEPMARTPGLIAAMGTPEVSASGDAYDRFPGPYLPGVYARLSAAFGG